MKGNAQILAKPEVQDKRKRLATQLYSITRKAVDWAEENGYSALMRDVDRFMKAYRADMDRIERESHVSTADYYARQSPERLKELLEREQLRAEKIKAALEGK